MKAIRISGVGGPEVFEWVDIADPTPGSSEVVVDVAAAGLNYIDTYHRTGLYPMDMPLVPGIEGAGIVSEVGDGVRSVSVGDRVMWASGTGSYAERRVVAAAMLDPVPDDIDLESAAALPVQAMTAHYLAVDTHRVKAGDRILVHAAAGGVGLLLTQIAKLRGAQVFATVSTDRKRALSEAAGADHVIRYDRVDFAEAVEEVAGQRPLAVVYDGVGASTFDQGLRLLEPRGLMVLYGQASGPVPPIDLQILAQNGSIFITRPTLFDYVSDREERLGRGADLFDWMRRGALDVRIGHRYPLEEADQAHRDLEDRKTSGKVLLIP